MISFSWLHECSRGTLIASSANHTFSQELTTTERRNSSDFGLLLKDSSTNPSHYSHCQNSKITPRTPEPCLASKELKKECLQTPFRSTKEEQDEDARGFGMQNTKTTTATKTKEIHVNAQAKEEEEKEKEELTASKCIYLNIQEDTDDIHTLVASLKACIKQRDLQTGSRIHANIVSRGFLQDQDNIFLGNTLVNMY
eukprot:c33197_g1_i1 orf=1-588(-)